jgi:putative hydrolase of HD superfamily
MQDLVNFLYEVGTLRRLKRSYHQFIFGDTESIAEHSYRVILIAYFLAKQLNADTNKVMVMAAFHDIPEARTGDSNWLQKPYITQDEDKALAAQLDPLGELSLEVKDILHEYKERKTIESRIAKDADNLDYVLCLRELQFTGSREADIRLTSENTMTEILYTEEAKELYKIILRMNPNEWTRVDQRNTHKKYIANATKTT